MGKKVDMLKEVAKTGKIKLMELYLTKTVETGAPLGQRSLNKPMPDIPDFQIRLADSSVTGDGHRGIVSETDRINFCRYLIRHGHLDKNILAKAGQLEQAWQKQQEEIKKQKEIGYQQFIEERKKSFHEIKNLWTYRHIGEYTDKAIKEIRSLTHEQKMSLKKQIRNNEFPARWTHEHRRDMLVLIESLEKTGEPKDRIAK